ncbi:hypothetical protein [Streptomyces sp.]|uniref:hypothetical protein n=1 Tax=Streptomyces sp. TaxID=1931 RepID=UPI0039C92646
MARENAGRAAVRGFLAAQGPGPRGTHRPLLTCVDGLVFDRLVDGGDVGERDARGLVAAALR